MALLDERLILPVEKAAAECVAASLSRHRPSGFIDTIFYSLSVGKFKDNGLIGQLAANDAKVSCDTLVQLFFLFSSGLIGR